MAPTRQGSLKLFRLAGIQVYLHWSWFLVAFYMIKTRARTYSSIEWNVFEYVGLFAIVLMHEFGHSLACRQVGGQADQIVLWPLGGVAYVAPPQRPGAMLWSIAAGPLVNVVLTPILGGLYYWGRNHGWAYSAPDSFKLLENVAIMNVLLLTFNLLPVYPLDGGQIFRSLLWYVIGRSKSLMVASLVGFVGVAGFLFYAFSQQSTWLGILGIFLGINCWRGFQHARSLARLDKLPRHRGFACPSCQVAPVQGPYWVCAQCQQPFDMVANLAQCPHCAAHYPAVPCLECGSSKPLDQWILPSATPVEPIGVPPVIRPN
ncbi:MAG: Peptidase [Verrucomicrobiales bacterium]|nr:Peptidase [Verrucomicrobiales bacterium]